MAAYDELRDPDAPSCARLGRCPRLGRCARSPGFVEKRAALAQQAESAARQANEGSNAGDVESDSFAQFCQNSPVLCSPAAAPASDAGYVQFCVSSPTLCTVAKSN